MNRADRSHVRNARAAVSSIILTGFSRRIYHPRWMARESILARAFVRELFTRRDAAARREREKEKEKERREFLVTPESYRSLLTTLHLFP